MKAKTLKEWIGEYENKTNDKFEIPEGFRICYLAERGFSVSKIDVGNNCVYVYSACGDGKFWMDFAKMQAFSLGLSCVCTIVTRDVEVYCRAMGLEILKIWEHYFTEGPHPCHRLLCQDGVGRKAILTSRGWNTKTQTEEFNGTLYVNEKVSLDDETLKELAKVGEGKYATLLRTSEE